MAAKIKITTVITLRKWVCSLQAWQSFGPSDPPAEIQSKHWQPSARPFTINWRNQRNWAEQPLGKLSLLIYYIKRIIYCHSRKRRKKKKKKRENKNRLRVIQNNSEWRPHYTDKKKFWSSVTQEVGPSTDRPLWVAFGLCSQSHRKWGVGTPLTIMCCLCLCSTFTWSRVRQMSGHEDKLIYLDEGKMFFSKQYLRVSCITGGFFTCWAIREPQTISIMS